MRSIYLDYNATTPLAPAVQEAMLPYLANRFGDPMSSHTSGRAAHEALEDARARVAVAIRASSDEIVWTSSGTESCNLALRGLIEPVIRAGERPHLIVSAVDHAAVQGPARFLASIGAELTVVPCNSEGSIAVEGVLAALRPNTRLVSITHANDEIGTVQPIAKIAAACRDEGVLFHTDASQSFGKLDVFVDELGVDLLSLSAHKTYGPKGVGAIYVRRGVGLEPLLYGDGQEGGLRSGTLNVGGVVGLGHAAKLAAESVGDSAPRLASLRDRLSDRLLDGAEGACVFGATENRLPNTLCVALPEVPATELLAAVPELSATACASCVQQGDTPRVSLSSTLRAIGADPIEAIGAIRLSIGWYTDEAEIDHAADALLEAWRQRR